MKHISTFENYILNENVDYQLLLEKFDYQLLLEGNNIIKTYKTIQDKTISKFSLNLYFVGTFQMGVTVLYPIIEKLINNTDIPSVTPEQIVLLTIFSITQIINLANNDVKKMREELEKDELLHLVEKVKKSLLSVYKIFEFISRSFGKIIDVFTDMLAYVSLCVPVAMAITEMVSKDGLNLDTLPQKALSFGAGAAVYAFKSMTQTVYAMVKNKLTFKKQT